MHLTHADFIAGESCCLDDVEDTDVYFDGITHTPAHDEHFFCDPCKCDRSLGTVPHKYRPRLQGVKAVKNSNAWENTSCSLWLTDVKFVNQTSLSPVSIDAVDPARYKLTSSMW